MLTNMILILDHHDSFTYNLYQYACEFASRVVVLQSDVMTISEIEKQRPDKIILSPGPGNPGEAKMTKELIIRLGKEIPMLGVCLGHQCIAEAFCATVVRSAKPRHGKCSKIYHDQKGVFKNLPNPITVVRYHSLIVDHTVAPIEISARTEDGEIMGLRVSGTKLEGVQFHPESILTEFGKEIIKNFVTGS